MEQNKFSEELLLQVDQSNEKLQKIDQELQEQLEVKIAY